MFKPPKPTFRTFWALCLSTLLLIAGTSRAQIPTTVISTVADAINQMEQQWAQDYSDYFGIPIVDLDTQVETVAETLRELEETTGRKAAVLWLMSTPKYLNLALTTPDTLAISSDIFTADAQSLERTLRAFQRGVSNPRRSNAYRQPAAQLYDWIIAPIADVLQRDHIDILLICGGKGLRAIPFGAFYDAAHDQFLIEQFSLAQIPAFNLLQTGHHPLKNAQVLAMGASEFTTLPDLPGVEAELQSIPLPRWQSRAFLNTEFTPDRLRQEQADCHCEIVHLATHAEFRPGTPDNSYIQFFDQPLGLDQVRQLGWGDPPVELVVLSACETASGDEDAELGFAGLAVQSGAKAALASLWLISDLGTVGIMGEFYHGLQTAPTKADALRQAQLAMLRGDVAIANDQIQTRGGNIDLTSEILDFTQEGQTFTHPYYWAAYTLIGNAW
ncbi:MAG: CHAT domain-containing protein [Spirulina sp. DLM2.Bin59]|nr:MAG: CHAT domain-containing protein [Spirulina sp. DLM2.Bin59]